MLHWIESHGLECLVAGFLFSGATSVMPPLPPRQGWWSTWVYCVFQMFGANLGNLIKHIPAGAQLEAMVGTQVKTEADGSRTTTEIATVSAPKA